MVRILFAALFTALVFFGWTTSVDATSKSYLTADGAARMMADGSFKAKWRTARTICVEAGFAPKTYHFIAVSPNISSIACGRSAPAPKD